MNKEDRMEATADAAVHTENDYVIELKNKNITIKVNQIF